MLVSHEMETIATGSTISHYRIISPIGSGGMGQVYLATDTKLDRKVAIKLLNAGIEANKSNVRRFIQEAKAASALNHPNILVIHEIGESNGAHYIVSEFVEGKTLREILNAGIVPLPEILDASIQVVSALAAAHGAGIVHRDIKPENIMVRPDRYVKVLDFGLAKLMQKQVVGLDDETKEQNNTAQGIILGTVGYMSPEQARGEKIDERTDIFSLGVLLYEMTTGKAPFFGESMPDTFANLINKEPLPLSRYNDEVPGELQRIVSKMLRKNRDDRYQTMKGLAADLKELKETTTVERKIEKSSSPETEKATQILHVETEGANRQTINTGTAERRIGVSRKSILYGSFAALLLGAVGFTWYWRQSGSKSQPDIKSIAVLPLKSLDAGENYLGLGIADALIRRISQTGELTVRPTSAIRRYLNEETDGLTAAHQLNADVVLEGNVLRSGDRLRVSVNLLRASDGMSLWAESFDMKMSDVFTIQDTVAQQVASRLRLRLDASQQARLTKHSTLNPTANEFYMKGVYALDQRVQLGKPQWEMTIGFFKQAIEADPNFALAHAQLAYAFAMMAAFIEPTEPVWAERAKEEIDRTQALDPQLAETHLARFQLLFSEYEGYQGEAAVREVLLAQQLNPNVGHAELVYLYGHLGLEDLATPELQRAAEIDPTSDYVKNMTRLMYEVGNKYDEYAAHREAVRDEYMDSWYFMSKGRLDEAQKAIDDWTAKKPDDIDLPRKNALLAALRGDFRSAEAAIPSILDRHPVKDPIYHHAVYDIARIYALEGKSADAVKWLREAAVTGLPCYPLFERDAYLDRIRQSSEFIKFMAEMKQKNDEYRREFQ